MSAQPMEEFEFGHMDSKTWIWWIACAGGLLGMATAFGLSWITEMSWPINVGGLPTFAWWPNLIIIFELTMLGAILATVGTLVVTAGLGRRSELLRSRRVGWKDPGRRRESCRRQSSARLEDALSALPGGQVKTI